jgi:hypothetical protein
MTLRATLMLALVFFSANALPSQDQATQNNRHPYLVSLIQVIANPRDFNGQSIKVVGFLARGGGLDRAVGLFVSETDGRNFIVPNSVDLHVDESTVKALMGRYVALSGTYHAPRGVAFGYNGYFDHILDIKQWNAGDAPK